MLSNQEIYYFSSTDRRPAILALLIEEQLY